MADDLFNSFMNGPDERGRFGEFGGRFVSETLMPLILELEAEYERAKTDDDFWAQMDDLWKNYVGRPSPLYFAERLTAHLGGAKIYLKRDELNHTGAHKINNRSEEHTSELQSRRNLVCRLLLEKKKTK